MKRKLLSMKAVLTASVLAAALVMSSGHVEAQTRNYASHNTSGASGGGLVWGAGEVVSPESAGDGNISTYAVISSTGGALESGRKQFVTMTFGEVVTEDKEAYLVLSQDNENPGFLNSLLGGTLGGIFTDFLSGVLGALFGNPVITVELLNSTGSVLSTQTVGAGDLIYGVEGFFYYKLSSSSPGYSSVRVRLSDASLAGGVTEIYVHDAFTLEGPSVYCEPFITTTYDATGLSVTVLNANSEPVTNPHYAIDGDLSTYSQLGYSTALSVDVGSTLYQTIVFDTLSGAEDEVLITFERAGNSVATLGLLSSVSVDVYNGSETVYTGTLGSLVSLELLGILDLAIGGTSLATTVSLPVTGAFDSVVISYAQTVAASALPQPFRIYDVTRAPRKPVLDVPVRCSELVDTAAITAAVTEYDYIWYDMSMDAIGTGTELPFTYPASGASDTFLVVAVNSCGERSAYEAVVITANDDSCMMSMISGTVDVSSYASAAPLNAVLTNAVTDTGYGDG